MSMALVLTGCGADSHAFVPAFMRDKETAPPSPEPPPDVARLVRDNLGSVFAVESHPDRVQVSVPYRDLHGSGWTACVKADFISVNGKPLGTQIYRIIIHDGMIADRRRIDDTDNCVSENYTPI